MRQLFLLFLLISFDAYSQDEQNFYIDELLERIQYVNNPNSNDTLCISEIERAKKDIKNGRIVFTQTAGLLFGDIRYESELRKLCKEYGLVFDFDLISDVIYEGQTQGCYGDFMDKVILERYGIGFKENLHEKADSLFLFRTQSENILVKYWDCDERPRLPKELERTGDYLTTIKVNNLNIVKDKSEFGGWPFFDLGFIIEKDSTISDFYISNFVPQLEENEKYRDDLYKIAVMELKTNYSRWIPGTIKGIPVRTDINVRIFFTKEE